MLITYAELIPLLIIILVGYSLKRVGLLASEDGGTLFRLLFYVGLPALIFTTFRDLDTSINTVWFALLPFIIVMITLMVIYLLWRTKFSLLDIKTFSALVAGAVIMNTGFLIPFVEQFYGESGLARLVVIDTFNGILIFGLAYAVIAKLGSRQLNKKYMFRNIATSPPLWALIVTFYINLAEVAVPATIDYSIGFIASLVGPIILLALGLQFNIALARSKFILPSLILRFVLGGTVGIAIVQLVGLSGVDAHIIILASLAPIGFNTIRLAELEKLESNYAAAQVSISLLVAIVMLPATVHGLSIAYPL